MESTNPATASGPRQARGRLRNMLIAAVLAFVLGGAVALYFAYRSGYLATETRVAASAPPAGAAGDAELRAAAPSGSATASTPLTARIQELERRLNRIDLQAEAASGNAARAEGLLIAFAARRLIERGERLGYLEDQLRLRFGDAQPNAVRTIIAAARNPVTIDQLRQRLEQMSAQVVHTPEEGIGWSRIKAEIGELFVLRRADAPSPQPEARLERALQLLDDRRVDAAAALVKRLPNQAESAAWLRDARRYVAAHEALDLIETAALLEPRRLNDASGQPVRQLSPAAPGGGTAGSSTAGGNAPVARPTGTPAAPAESRSPPIAPASAR